MKVIIFLGLVILSHINNSFSSDFDEVISSYEKRLAKTSRPTIFMGSSTFGYWNDLEIVFKDYNAVNAGLSGSRVDHLLRYKKRILANSSPRAIVIYAGENDIVHGDNLNDIENKMRMLINYIRKNFEVPIFILSLKAAPNRIEFRNKILELNSKLQSFSYVYKDVYYVDFESELYDECWQLGDYFKSDGVHLNTKGNKILSTKLKASIDKYLKYKKKAQ